MQRANNKEIIKIINQGLASNYNESVKVEDLDCLSEKAKEILLRDLKSLRELNKPLDSLIKYIKIKKQNFSKEKNNEEK